MSLKATISKNIRRLRDEKGLTQEQLAKAAGKTIRYVSHIETAEQNITVDTLETVARALGCSVEDLLAHDSEAPQRRTGKKPQTPVQRRAPLPKAAAVGLDAAIKALKELRRQVV